MVLRFRYILLIFFSSLICLNAQIPFEKLESEEAIELALDIIRDDNGYVWIATNGLGLIRHNSYTADVYRNRINDSSTICHNVVICLLQDSKGNLWIGTRNGLNRYIRNKESFVSYYTNKKNSTSLSSNIISSIYQDKGNRLWIVTSKGIDLYNYESDSFTRYADTSVANEFFEYTAIAEDTNNNLWVTTTYNGVYKFIPETNKFEYFPDNNHPEDLISIKKIYVDSKNNIWIGSRTTGLSLFDAKTGTFNYFPITQNGNGTNGNIVYDIFQEDENHLLVAVDQGGINRYDYRSQSFEYISTRNNNAGNLASDGIYCFHKDKEDILWVGTSRGGVSYYNPKKKRFKTYRSRPDMLHSSLSNNIIGCFFEDDDGTIWIGTDGGGVSVFNPKTNSFRNYMHVPNNENSLSSNVIRTICEDSNGDKWIATFDKGINKFDSRTKRFKRVELDPSFYKTNETIQNMLIDQKGRFWIGFPHGAILLLDKNLKEITRFFKTASKHTIRRPYVVEMANGKIYLLTNEGVFLFSEDDFNMEQVIFQTENTGICINKKGLFFLGTIHKGVTVYDSTYNLIKVYNESNGLAYNAVSYLVEGNDDNIWVATMNGLSSINPNNDNITNYYELDGLQGNLFFLQSGLKTSTGELYFGGTNGFTRFNPKEIKINLVPPPVYIDGFYLFNKKVSPKDPGSPLKNEVHSSENIILNYKQDIISFEFSAINFTYPLKNRYQYKLDGFDENWVNTNAYHRSATYTNLDAGEYVFRVRASNNDHILNKKEARVKVIIKPPFWKTLWFYTILTVFAFASIYVFTITRERKLKHDKQNLQKKVIERTRLISNQHAMLNDQNKLLESQKAELQKHRNDLEKMIEKRTKDLAAALEKSEKSDKLKTAFLANMSHEIRTPMNAIIGFSDLLLDDYYTVAEQKEFISLVISNSQVLLRLIEDLLDLSLIETGQLPIENKPFGLNEFINNVYASYMHHKEKSSIDIILQNELEPFNYSLNSDESRIRQIVTNLINNALKFTSKGYIKIGIIKENDKVVFYVKDSGKGIKQSDLDIIFNQFVKFDIDNADLKRGLGLGLSISKRLSYLLNGDLSVSSKVGSGSDFKFSLPATLLGQYSIEEPKVQDTTSIENWEDKTFLVVEDEIANYRFLQELLSRTKSKIFWAQNGLEAIHIFSDNPRIDIVLLDIKLPVMDGYETLKWIKKDKPDQVVIAQTAYAYQGDIQRMEEAGFTDYITKPIKSMQLFKTIKKYI